MIDRRPVVIANQIKMHRSQHRGSFVLVEGKDDKLFCQRVTNNKATRVIVAEGKENVCDTIGILDRDGFRGVLGLVDADFDHIEGKTADSPNIVATELHDLECVQVQSAGLEAVLLEFASEPKLRRFERDVEHVVLSAARPIGCLRLYSARNALNLRFAGINYAKFVDKDALSTNNTALIREVKGRSNRPDLSEASLANGIDEIEQIHYDGWQLCNGDDLLGILGVGLRRLLGNQSAGNVRACRLRQVLRVASSSAEVFGRMELKEAFLDWELRNQGFKLL